MKGKVLGLMVMVLGLLVLAGCQTGTTESATIIGDVVINASVEKVWDYMCSGESAKANPYFKGVSNQQGERCTVGYSQEETYQAMGMTSIAKTVTVEVVPNHRIVSKAAGDVDSTTTVLFVPEGKGTRLTIISELTGKLPPGMGYEAVKQELQKNQDKNLENIKNAVEK